LKGYVFSVAALVVATIAGFILRTFIEPASLIMIFLLPVLLSAISWGLGPSLLSSILAPIIFDYFFDPPFGLVAPNDSDLLRLAIFLLIGLVIAKLGSQIREQEQVARRREKQTAALYTLTRDMALANNRAGLLDAAIKQIGQVFDADAAVLMPAADGSLQFYQQVEFDEMDLQAAQWAFENVQSAGAVGPAFGQALWSYLPLRTAQGSLGVLCLRRRRAGTTLTPYQRQLLETFAGQIAIALEHAKLSEQAEQARILESSERLRNALLSSLSHDLLTPITSVMGSVTTLLDDQVQLDRQTRRELLVNAKGDAAHLRNLVLNLLDMTRLESGALVPRRDWHSVEEVVGAALAQADTNTHEVQLNIEPHLPLIAFDFVLIEQVLLNLLDNACKFSSPDSVIELAARLDGADLRIAVSDQGIGVPPEELEHIFEKFYRLRQKGDAQGTGLGLSICKGIVEAHGGTIWAECGEGGGTRVTFALPASRLTGE
jgi:two-component system, OmpR family, sensor histidine kinase KdpD